MKKIRITLFLFVVSVLSCSADDKTEINRELDGITISNFPIIDGSNSTEPLRKILMCKLLGFDYEWVTSPFIQNPEEAPKGVMPHFACTEEEEHYLRTERVLNSNTHQSFIKLIDGNVELILTARSISRDEKVYAEGQGVTLIEKPIAKDALTFMVNPVNRVDNLTIEQIQGIYTGDIVNWNEVGGADELITPYVRNRNSGSQEKFETMVMEGLTIKDFPEMQIGQTMMSPYYQLEEDGTGIAYTPFYYYSVMVATGSTRAIGVNGAAMTKENIMNGTYPYISDVYAAVRSDIDRSSTAYKVFEYLTATGGQAIVEESGYIPLASCATGIKETRSADARLSFADGAIQVQSISRPTWIQVTGVDGKVLLRQRMATNSFSLPEMESGTYIVRVTFADGGSCVTKMQW